MGEQFGRYVLRRRLGVGGMAEVYEAVAYYVSQSETTDPASPPVEKPLVIKRILEEHSKNDDFRSMFVDEARIAMRLSHPNIVQVFDFGKADDRYFLAMELVKGRDLGALLARAAQEKTRVPHGVALFIISEVAKGLDYAHRLAGLDGRPLGLVHRDVSPQNILISSEGAVKIGDFGIAKFNQRREMTAVMSVRGKVRYMSPEQVSGEDLDARSDLFALGLVLYEVVCGRPAFDGKTDLEVLDQVRRCAPPKPSSLGVPLELEKVILRLISPDRDRRPARGNDVQRELERIAASLSVRFTSGAVAEYLNGLFPEIETRLSEPTGVTQIRRMPSGLISVPPAKDGEVSESSAGLKRFFEEDGIPVFVSEEVPVADLKDTRETSTRRPSPVPAPAPPPEPEPTVPPAAPPPVSPRASIRRGEPTHITGVRPAGSPSTEETTSTRKPARPRPSATSPVPPVGSIAPPPSRTEVTPPSGIRQQAPPRADVRLPLLVAGLLAAVTVVVVFLRFTPAGASLGTLVKGSGQEEPPLIAVGAADPSKGTDAKVGYLLLVGRAGDEVTVDGQDLGPLPLAPIALEAGRFHEVVVKGKDHYQDVFSEVVQPGDRLTKNLR